MSTGTFATRARIVQDTSTSLPQTLRSLGHLVGVATARFQVQMEVARECASELHLLDAQLGEFIARQTAMSGHDTSFLVRLGAQLRLLQTRLEGAAQ